MLGGLALAIAKKQIKKTTRKRKRSYKTGKDNEFSKDYIKQIVKKRMIENNPMKDDTQKLRMKERNNNPKTKSIIANGISFLSFNEASRYFNTSVFLFKKNSNYSYNE